MHYGFILFYNSHNLMAYEHLGLGALSTGLGALQNLACSKNKVA